MKQRWIQHTLALVVGAMAIGAQAAWPEKPIKLVVPYAAGGAADVLARVVATELASRLKQPVVVDNRGGAGGTIGAQVVAQAAPDGYTFLYDATAFTVNPNLYPKLSFSYARDFAPVGMVARIPTLLVVPAASPVNSMADLLQRARVKPGHVNYASAGNGGAAHLSGELFAQGYQLQLTHVAYRGGAPALADLAGGHVDMMFSAITASGPLVKAGKLKAIATAFDKRIHSMPDVPTVAESGLRGFSAYEWNGIWAPAATPPDVLKRIESELKMVLADPAIRQRLTDMGAIPAEGGAQALAKFVSAETAKWADVIKTARITLD